MIPAAFDYHAPGSLDEAVGLLTKLGDEAKVLSGGQSLLPLLKLRLGFVTHVVDIGRIQGLEYVKEEGKVLRIGGATREATLDRSDLIRTKYPLLHDATLMIADPLVRNRATVGGNLAHGDPANDHPAVMLAYGATVVARGPQGERTIPIGEFFKGLFQTALAPTEILTEIRIPVPPAGSGGAYQKLERKVGDYATAAAAVQLTVEKGKIAAAGIALTNAGTAPVKAGKAEAHLIGKAPTAEVFAEAAKLAAQAAQPSADWRGSVEYKTEMARVMTARALARAADRAAGGK